MRTRTAVFTEQCVLHIYLSQAQNPVQSHLCMSRLAGDQHYVLQSANEQRPTTHKQTSCARVFKPTQGALFMNVQLLCRCIAPETRWLFSIACVFSARAFLDLSVHTPCLATPLITRLPHQGDSSCIQSCLRCQLHSGGGATLETCSSEK